MRSIVQFDIGLRFAHSENSSDSVRNVFEAENQQVQILNNCGLERVYSRCGLERVCVRL